MTQREMVRSLCKSIVTRLENNKAITFPPRLRQIVQEEVFNLVGPYIMTDQDLKEKALAKMGAKAESLSETGLAESDQFKAAKAVVRSSFGEDELNGFYFLKSLKEIATTIAQYLMRSSHIDDVYETDEELEQLIVDTIKKFNPKDLH